MAQSRTTPASRPLVVLVLVLCFLLFWLVPGYTLWTRVVRPAALAFFLILGIAGLSFHWNKARRNATPLESATRTAYLVFFGTMTLISGYHLLRFALSLI